VQADIKNDACWPNEIRADPSKRGERRRSVLIPKQDGRAENIGCLWRYNSNDAHCETEPEYTMQYELKRELSSSPHWQRLTVIASTDTCYTFDTGTMSHDYGSASSWFTHVRLLCCEASFGANETQGHCPEGYKRQSIGGVAFDSDTGLKIDG
jgi:hypothetical protein